MKNNSLLLVFFFSLGTIIAQTKKAPISKQIVTNEVSKKGMQSDTAKTKIAATEKQTVLDTTVIEKGKFKLFKSNAHASYYADKFHGKKTASGKIFDMHKYTCAHKNLPFGTKLKVTNEKNGKFVIVEVTDRGPFVKGRELDLSKRAFKDIASNSSAGSVIVTIEQLQK